MSILSYAGGVQFGLITDAKMCPDPDVIIERFAPEFEKLLYLALMGGWHDGMTPEDAEALTLFQQAIGEGGAGLVRCGGRVVVVLLGCHTGH